MNLYLKIILILLGLAYLISPVDIIPDLLVPFAGWIDDGVVLWIILHLIRHGELPWVSSKKKSGPKGKGPLSSKESNEKNALKSAHEILGVSPNATWTQIQTAYKEKIKQYHPDKVSHLGAEFSDLANEKFLEIQRAYEALKTK
ncbi:MAG: DnaJ domain-containing protein [Proteobacteria bacterium]|nr:DnaJ domain-containing protein [Pseudomonadota bacterium]